jgi:hypothetical protein
VALKTTRNDNDVDEFLNSVENDLRRRDALAIKDLMAEVTGCKPEMWGTAIVGFCPSIYKPKSGAEQEWFKVGFSPRKQSLTLYLASGFRDDPLLERLGSHTTSKACLYIRNLDKVDIDVLRELIRNSVASAEG